MINEAGNHTPHRGLDQILSKLERAEIVSALRETRGNRAHAARWLGISRTKFYRRLRTLDIDPDAEGGWPGKRVPQGPFVRRGDEEARRGPRLDAILAQVERREVVSALRETEGQRTLAARRLGISRSKLYRRMDALGIDPDASTPAASA